MLDSIYETVKNTVTDLNPVADNISKQDKKIIDCLMQNGFKMKDIVRFVDVYKSDVKDYIDLRKEALKEARKLVQSQQATP
jgi:DNA-binding transcriptional MerR regulator